MGLGTISGEMDPNTSENGRMTKSMDKESTFGKMEDLMRANGKIITCTVKASTNGPMAGNIKVVS